MTPLARIARESLTPFLLGVAAGMWLLTLLNFLLGG